MQHLSKEANTILTVHAESNHKESTLIELDYKGCLGLNLELSLVFQNLGSMY